MASTCESNKWFLVYFTSVNNIAKCDICDTILNITATPKMKILRHIKTIHRVDYQRIVSSGISQKDLESQLYIIQDNDVTCKFCYLTLNAITVFNNMRKHLEKTHKIKEDRATEICEWLRKHYFDESDMDKKRRCSSCNEIILNKPIVLMSHLSKVHKVNVPLESVGNWVWEYYTRSEGHEAKCSVCNEPFVLRNDVSTIKEHIRIYHDNILDLSYNSQADKDWPYSITENNQVKCDNCDFRYDPLFYDTPKMKTHLIKEHNLNEEIARKLCNWILEYFHISNIPTSKCNICENMLQTSNSFNLMIHLKEAHKARVSPEIIPARLSSELSSLLNPDRCAENNAPSTSCNQPSRNVDQSSDRDNLYDEIDNSSEMETTRLSSELSSLFNSDRCEENNAPSTTCNQPPRNVDQSSDCDDLYDQINNPSEMETTRLSSELSSLFNSDRCAENNAPSTSYNQPLRNVDQSSDCDNHYVQIDNCSEIKTTRYKKWRQSRYY